MEDVENALKVTTYLMIRSAYPNSLAVYIKSINVLIVTTHLTMIKLEKNVKFKAALSLVSMAVLAAVFLTKQPKMESVEFQIVL